ncbi:hypothetical protein CFT13S00388_00805 [Campylobacter fetus subsp. testudinum]|uniref:type 4a pilus biogenesis protein PilO n=1 Tax=Campylobacter fetus TaxID=196 RepID=UPI0008188101|nr:type 4a pilus biogenesis protein PilO [Campylobacter fetus]OCR88786.1 hypothetical protein CFT13S00388_00805 [Campylobacter fetus subsp. testudinum]
MNIENILSRLDEYFAKKKKNEVYLIFVAMFLIISYTVYMFVLDRTSIFYEDKLSGYKSAQEQYLNLKNTDEINSNIAISEKTYNQNISNLKKLKDDNSYLNKELQILSESIFNEKDLNKFLDYLALEAKNNNISVVDITNNSGKIKPLSVEKFYDINVSFQANFNNIVRYVSTLERSNNVVDIQNLDINVSQNNLNGNLNIIVWGIKSI